MNHTTQLTTQQITVNKRPLAGGLSVRTGLCAGSGWNDVDDQTKALWEQWLNNITAAYNSLAAGNNTAKPAA